MQQHLGADGDEAEPTVSQHARHPKAGILPTSLPVAQPGRQSLARNLAWSPF